MVTVIVVNAEKTPALTTAITAFVTAQAAALEPAAAGSDAQVLAEPAAEPVAAAEPVVEPAVEPAAEPADEPVAAGGTGGAVVAGGAGGAVAAATCKDFVSAAILARGNKWDQCDDVQAYLNATAMSHAVVARAYAIRDGSLTAIREHTVAKRRADIAAYFKRTPANTRARLVGVKTLDQMKTIVDRSISVNKFCKAIDALPDDANMEQVYLAVPLDDLLAFGW